MPTENPGSKFTAAHSLAPPASVSAADIDRSYRTPLLCMVTAALLWLVGGLGLLLMASIKLHGPSFLAGTAWLSYGRLAPAGLNAVLYGFGCPAALGLMLWLLFRLSGVRLSGSGAMLIGAAGWNGGVLLGVAGILAGGSTGFGWLEMPGFVGPILLLSFVMMAVPGFVALAGRRNRSLYVSQWYGLVLLAVWPVAWALAQWMLVHRPVRGVLQAVVAAWYQGVWIEVCLAAAGLALIFYFIPERTGRPLHSRGLAVFGFWVLVLFGPWTGCAHLLGGPVPAWVLSVSVAANRVLLAAVVAVGLNWWRTLYRPGQPIGWGDLTLRYMLMGGVCYLVASLEGFLLASRSVSVLTRFTLVEPARAWLMVLGAVGMPVLGAVHELVPRWTGRPWPWPRLGQVQFWGWAIGLGLVWLGWTAAGGMQGFRLMDPSEPVEAVSQGMVGFVGVATLGWLLMLGAQGALVVNLVRLLRAALAPWWAVVRGLTQPMQPSAPTGQQAKA